MLSEFLRQPQLFAQVHVAKANLASDLFSNINLAHVAMLALAEAYEAKVSQRSCNTFQNRLQII